MVGVRFKSIFMIRNKINILLQVALHCIRTNQEYIFLNILNFFLSLVAKNCQHGNVIHSSEPENFSC
jgi:hypothetical protein